jgi:Ca2+-binding RTX toxin-like protein
MNLATIVPADSTITVTADGTIDFRRQPCPGENLPYAPNDTSTIDPNLAGSVSVLSNATINTAGGYGIWAFNLGIGNVTVTTQAGSSITVGSSSTTSVRIAAYALDGANAGITNAGTVTLTGTSGSNHFANAQTVQQLVADHYRCGITLAGIIRTQLHQVLSNVIHPHLSAP